MSPAAGRNGTRGAARRQPAVRPEWMSVTRVCSPIAMNVTSAWLARSGSWPGCQLKARANGGAQPVIVPHRALCPPGDRSTISSSAIVTVPPAP